MWKRHALYVDFLSTSIGLLSHPLKAAIRNKPFHILRDSCSSRNFPVRAGSKVNLISPVRGVKRKRNLLACPEVNIPPSVPGPELVPPLPIPSNSPYPNRRYYSLRTRHIYPPFPPLRIVPPSPLISGHYRSTSLPGEGGEDGSRQMEKAAWEREEERGKREWGSLQRGPTDNSRKTLMGGGGDADATLEEGGKLSKWFRLCNKKDNSYRPCVWMSSLYKGGGRGGSCGAKPLLCLTKQGKETMNTCFAIMLLCACGLYLAVSIGNSHAVVGKIAWCLCYNTSVFCMARFWNINC